MKKIQLFIAEDFKDNVHYSTKSHQDIIDGTTEALMPGSFSKSTISEKQFKKLESDPSYFLKITRAGLRVMCN